MVSFSDDERESHQSNEWGGEDHGGDCSFLRICLLCYLVSEVLLSGWKKPPTVTFLLSNLPFTSKITTKSLGTHCLPACSAIAGTCLSSWFCYPLAMTLRRCWSPICGIGFSPLKFLSCSKREAWVACYLDVNRAEWAYWSTELATFESGWNPWGGGAKVNTGTL